MRSQQKPLKNKAYFGVCELVNVVNAIVQTGRNEPEVCERPEAKRVHNVHKSADAYAMAERTPPSAQASYIGDSVCR